MTDYRLYFLRGRRIQRAIKIQAMDDSLALDEAVVQSEGQPVELWQGGRPIGFIRGGAVTDFSLALEAKA